MHRRRRGPGIVALALAVVLPLTSCSGSSSSGDESGGKGTTTLAISSGRSGQFTRNLNPFVPSTLNATRGMIYQTLLFFNRAKSGDIRPVLATDYSWNGDGTEVTFTLREGVKWSDGKAFTSADVAFTFNLIRKNDALNGYGLPLESVSAPDKHTVTLTFSRPSYTMLWYAAGQTYLLPEHIWSDVDDPETFANPNPVGTGPYMLKSFSAQNYVVEKNPDYWDRGKPQVDQFRYVSFSGNQGALRALRTGKLDWATTFIPDIKKAYASHGEHNEWGSYPANITNLVPNNARGPTADVAVRKAIYYGIDRAQLNKLAYTGLAGPTTPAQLLLERDKKWLAPDLEGVRAEQNVSKARQILEDAGYTEGSDGIYRDPDGNKLSTETLVVSGYTDQITPLQVIKDNLAKVGRPEGDGVRFLRHRAAVR